MTIRGAIAGSIRLFRQMRRRAAPLSAALPFLVAVELAAAPTAQAAPQFSVLVVDADTGHTVVSQNPDAQTYPASLTKMMTLYLTFEALEAGRLKLEQALPVSELAAAQSPTKLGLLPGSTITARNAIMGVITRSANDAAVVLAEALGGSQTNFAARMTAKARALGMNSTIFVNANGLPNPAQHTTARDMTKLGLALMRDHPAYFPLFSTKSFVYGGTVIQNHNRMLGKYQGVTGIKTGYINASGFNLVVSVTRDGHNLVGAIFGGRSAAGRDTQMIGYLDMAMQRLERQPQLVAQGPVVRPNAVRNDAASAPVLAAARTAEPADDAAAPQYSFPGDRASRPVQTADAGQAAASPAPNAPLSQAELDAKVAQINREMEAQGDSDDDEAMADTDQPREAAAPVRTAALPAARPAPQPSAAGQTWVIQLGAFRREEAARNHLVDALKSARGILTAGQMAVHQGSDGEGTIYRARFVGMSETQAREACLKLKQKALNCIALRLPATMASLVSPRPSRLQ